MGIFDKLRGKKQKELQTRESMGAEKEAGLKKEDLGSDKNDFIQCYDEYGRKMMISKDQWVSSVLPQQLQSHWNDPGLLYNDILLSLEDGFYDEVVSAAEHLKDIDNIKERGYTILAIVYMKKELYSEAGKILNEYIRTYGKTGTILTNMAKVYYAQKNETQAMEVLWEGLCLEPNQDNGLPWWGAIHYEKGGKEEYVKALEKASEIKGSWLPQIYLARYYLGQKEFNKAKAFYDYIITVAKDEPQALYIMSGDIGNSGYINEIIEIIAPIYDIEKHDIRTGLNLLQAYLQTKNYIDGKKLLNKIMQIKRPDLREYLINISNEFEKIKEAKLKEKTVNKDEVKYEIASIDKPVWYYGLKSPDWLLPANKVNKRVGIFVYSNIAISNGDTAVVQREDDIGRLTRSIPLFIGETILFCLNFHVVNYFPVAKNLGPVVSRRECETGYLQKLAESNNLDYVITGSICFENSYYKLNNIIFDSTSKSVHSVKGELNIKDFGQELTTLTKDILAKVSDKMDFSSWPESHYILPASEIVPEYLSALGQSLMQSFVDNEFVKFESMWSERNILNWYMNLSLAMPENPIPKIMFASGLAKSKSYGSEIYKEFKDQIVKLLQDEKSDTSSAEALLPFVYKLFDMESEYNSIKNKFLDISSDERYKEWLSNL